ncbi:dimethyl sulfoxide reductase anchor subunit family protein [Bacteroidota bacterium]
MHSSEWALVTFTILVQISAGFYLALAVFNKWTTSKYDIEGPDFLGKWSLISVFALIILSAIVSFFHLGNPLYAFYSIANINSSWLSREILLLIIYILFSGIFTYIHKKKLLVAALRGLFGWIVVVIGMILIYSMANIYMLPTVPTWNTITTPITFYLTSLLLGIISLFLTFFIDHQRRAQLKRDFVDPEEILLKKSLKLAVILGLSVIIVEVGMNIVQAANHVTLFAEQTGSKFTGNSNMIWFLRYRIISGFIGLFILIFAYNRSAPRKILSYRWVIYTGLLCIFLSQLLGRIFFYSTYLQGGI